MRRIILVNLFSILLAGCSLPTIQEFLLIPSITPSLPPTVEITLTPTETFTPTQPTPTFTYTPTQVGAKTPTQEGTLTPTETATAHPTVLVLPPTPAQEGFTAINLSTEQFYLRKCEPTEVKFTVQVAEPTRVAWVVLFVRFKSRITGATSEWTSITMDSMGAGTFIHNLSANEMKAVGSFEYPWVQYQFVATDLARKEIGRTQIFDEKLSLVECIPTPPPTITPAQATDTPSQ
jgi:hypothetical protein